MTHRRSHGALTGGVILDLALPDLDGLAVCRELRSWLTAPILVLTVRGGEGDKVAALDGRAPFPDGDLPLMRRVVHGPANSRLPP